VIPARCRGCALALGIMLSLAPAAWAGANHHVLGNDGVWEVDTGMDSRGNSYCSIRDQSADKSYALQMIIYPLGNAPSFVINAFRDQWSIPDNAAVPTKFNFSNGSSWNADGAAMSRASVNYTIDMKDMKKFLNDFSQSDSLDIVFTNGTEPAWKADLSSTSQATSDLLACTNKLLGAKGGPTQPYSQ
jgi:hypothetical protein